MAQAIRVGTFSPSVVLDVAARTGALAAAELDVVEVPATSSTEQVRALVAGALDAALTSPDNVLTYRCVPNNPLGATHDVRILAAVDLATVLAAVGPAVDADQGPLRRLVRALTATAGRLAGGELRDVAVAAATDRLGLDAAAAQRYADTLVDPVEGLVPDGRADREALTTLLALRNRWAGGAAPKLDPLDVDAVLAGGLVDDRFLGVALRVNGERVVVDAAEDTPLIYALRGDLGLAGTRFGCGSGLCGSCLVLVDGRPVPSCDTPLWAVRDAEVTTVEGLTPHPVQQALLDEQAAQCGYCISGIVVNAAALLAADPHPTDAAVRAHLDRNLCRCGTHNRVVRAVLRAAGAS